MYCSGCGQSLPLGQGFCPQCGRPVAAVVPPVPGMEFQQEGYACRVRALGIFWCIYAGLSLLLGTLGLAFAKAFFSHHFGNWGNGEWGDGQLWFGPALIHFIWVVVVLRSGLALMAGWGLLQRTEWGRILAIISAFLSILKFPFGTALGIWTLVVLLGYRNSRLYEQL